MDGKKYVKQLIPKIKVDKAGCPIVDPISQRTNLNNVYAGGDSVNGGKEVVHAVSDGKKAAFAMLESFGLG